MGPGRPAGLAGGHHPDRQFEHYTARHVEVSTATELRRELDGDLIAPGRSLAVNIGSRALLVRAPGPWLMGRPFVRPDLRPRLASRGAPEIASRTLFIGSEE